MFLTARGLWALWQELVLVLSPPLAFLRAGEAGRWAEGEGLLGPPPPRPSSPRGRRATCLPLQGATELGACLWTRPGRQGCPLGHTPLYPSGHGPWTLSQAVPRGGQSQQVDLQPPCPLHVMGHDSESTPPCSQGETREFYSPGCQQLRGGEAPGCPCPPASPSWSRKCLISAVPVSPQARNAAGRRGYVSCPLPPFACGYCCRNED